MLTRKLLASALLAGTIVSVPAAAYAAEKRYDFFLDGENFNTIRVPANKDNDVSMPARAAGNGQVLSNMNNCPERDAGYNISFKRNRAFRPDEEIVGRDNRQFCSGQLVLTPSWPAGDFHFDFGARYLDQPDGRGYGGTRW